MELNDYQEKAMTTCMASSNNFAYMMLNLQGEVGETAEKSAVVDMPADLRFAINEIAILGEECGKLAKKIRKTEEHPLQKVDIKSQMTEEQQKLMFKELGDIMWQVAGLTSVMGWKLEDVCWENLLKLQDRKHRGVIDGNGDER